MSRHNLSTALLTVIILTAAVTSAYAQDGAGPGDVQAVNGKKVLTQPAAVAANNAVAATSATATQGAANSGAAVSGARQVTGAAATGSLVKSEGANDLKGKTGMVKSEGANDLQGGVNTAATTASGH